MSSAAVRLSENADWGTPPHIVEFAREVLGGIDFDPASSPRWNARTVRAESFMDGSPGRDGLQDPWPEGARVWCNPPGDRSGQQVKAFWTRLTREYAAGKVASAVWLGFSLEQLVSCQHETLSPLKLPILIPNRRLQFSRERAEVIVGMRRLAEKRAASERGPKTLRPSELRILNECLADPEGPPVLGTSPTHGSFLTLLPSHNRETRREQLAKWAELGAKIGAVRT